MVIGSIKKIDQPKASVIIPAYNSAATIEKCLGSLLAQDYPGLELIVVDDASTDDTLEKASKYPVKIISKTENHGAGHSRNLGVEKSSSEIIIFVDSDVVVPPTGVSQAVRTLMEERNILAVGGAYSQKSNNLNFISEFKNIDLAYRANLDPGYLKFSGSYFFAIKKSVFLEAGGFSTNFLGANVEDIEFCYRLTKGSNIIFLNKDIRVDHLKRYTFLSMLKTDFNRIIGMMKIIKKSKGSYKTSVEIPTFHIINLFLPGLILISIIIGIKFKLGWLMPLLISVFLINNLRFTYFLIKKRGFIFSLKSLFILFIEYIVAGLATFISFFIVSGDKT